MGMGDKFDPARGQALNAGGYLHLPKRMHHYEWTTEDTVIELSGANAGKGTQIPISTPSTGT